jgi:hypothetical protein
MKKFFGHLKTVCIHKYYVFIFCCRAGIPWRGIKHDLSKFSPTEFFESVKYYSGTRSPIDACKEDNGYSLAWNHHKGRNTHHWEYWVDNLGTNPTPIQMPYKDAVEMLCDYLGASKAYTRKKKLSTIDWLVSEVDWWTDHKRKVLMHPKIEKFITIILNDMCNKGYYWKICLNPDYLKWVYWRKL